MATERSLKAKSYWAPHVKAWQQSELSQAGYCRLKSLDIKAFSYWKRSLVGPHQKDPISTTELLHSDFAEVLVQQNDVFSITMVLPNDTKMYLELNLQVFQSHLPLLKSL